MTKPRTSKPKVVKPIKPKPPLVLPEFAGRTKEQIVAELGKSPHGQLDVYRPLVDMTREDPAFLAHLVTWNAVKGEVKDARVALPVTAYVGSYDPELRENALANMVGLDPRLFIRALKFAHSLKASPNVLRRLVHRRLADLEADEKRWTRVAVQHRASLHYLYRRYHAPRPEFVARNIFEEEQNIKLKPVPGSVFDAIQKLSTVTNAEAAGLILKHKIPFLAVRGALGKRATEPDIAFALIEAMTPTELIHNTKDLQKNYGLRQNPMLRAAFEKALEKAGQSKKGPTLKAGRAAEALEDVDTVLAAKMQALQEQRMETISVDGNWLVLGDKSGSMQESITAAIEIAATLARSVKGTVHLIFFDVIPYYFDVTGLALDAIKRKVRHVIAGGGTSIGCGVSYALDKGLDVDGIAVVSDGAENRVPMFVTAYQQYTKKLGKEMPVYFYQMTGESNRLTRDCEVGGIPLQTFDMTHGTTDYYSLPNIVKTMKISRYGLVDEIMHMPLLTLDEVLPRTTGRKVIHAAALDVVS